MRRRALAVAIFALGLAALPASALGAKWDTTLLAQIPTPGFPALAYVHPNGRIYEGTYDNPSGSTAPSRVLEYTGDGELLRSWTILGQNLSGAHGVQVATSETDGTLVLLDESPARVLLLDTKTGTQRTYATFADQPDCGTGSCTATPDYAAWGPDGTLYVTDYQQGLIWKVPPGGGAAKVWLKDPKLNGMMFGTAGLALAADHKTLVVGNQSEAGAMNGDPTTGRIFTVPILPDGSAGALTQIWESRPLDAPDGFAIAKSGDIYVAGLLANQLIELSPQGKEIDRFPADGANGANGTAIPFDSPSSVKFLGDAIIVACQSYASGTAANQAIFKVQVGEPGLPELISYPPVKPAPAPAKKKKKKKKTKTHHKAHAAPKHSSHK